MDNLHFDIRKVREDMGMTQEEFSEFCGLSRSSIARYELGTNPPNRAALKKIATALNTTVSVLLGEESADQEQQKKEPAVDLSGFDPDLVEAMRDVRPEEKAAVLALISGLKASRKE